MFAHQYEGVKPDMVIIGKALSGGYYPVSAVLSNKEVLGVFNPGDHGSTFGGNPLGAAIAREALQILTDEKLIEKSNELGKYFREKLSEVGSHHVKEIRGKGLMIAIEFTREAELVQKELIKRGFIVAKRSGHEVLRIDPALTIKEKDTDAFIHSLDEIITYISMK